MEQKEIEKLQQKLDEDLDEDDFLIPSLPQKVLSYTASCLCKPLRSYLVDYISKEKNNTKSLSATKVTVQKLLITGSFLFLSQLLLHLTANPEVLSSNHSLGLNIFQLLCVHPALNG